MSCYPAHRSGVSCALELKGDPLTTAELLTTSLKSLPPPEQTEMSLLESTMVLMAD